MAVALHNGLNGSLHDSLSRPGSQDPSPSSPTASFTTQQQHILYAPSRSPYTSDPGTPTSVAHGLLDPPPSMSFAAFMQTWSDDHVAKWLSDHRLAHLATAFKDNDIKGDVLLDLNQPTLKEMGITSVGERIRILNAIKILRQKYLQSAAQKSHHNDTPSSRPTSRESSPTRRDFERKLELTRPAPLQLNSHSVRSDFPRLVRDGSDSARIDSTRIDSSKSTSSIRPLPQPSRSSHSSTPHTAHSSSRPNLPPLPPPPQGLPPLPPNGQSRSASAGQSSGRKTPNASDTNPYNNQPSSTSSYTHGLLTPTGGTGHWAAYGLPSDPRPGNRTPVPNSPLASQRLRSPVTSATTHGRNTSMSSLNPNFNPPVKLSPRPSTGQNPYPFTTPSNGSTLSAAQQLASLSPIAESFVYQSGSPSPPATSTSYRIGPGPLRPTTPSAPTLDDLKRKLVRFELQEAGQSCTINTEDCAGGIDILEKALKKLNRNLDEDDSIDDIGSNDGGLSVDGWGVFLDVGQNDSSNAKPLTESQLLAFCHSPPDDPVRGHSLLVRKVGRGKRSKALHQIFGVEPPHTPLYGLTFHEDDTPSPQISGSFAAEQADLENIKRKRAKRASTVSVLSGLGVSDPEKALDLPKPASPIPPLNTNRSPSKLRNFFGQRPPSELITNHLAEYFPYTEKKVLERTRRRSVLRVNESERRDSIVSWNAPGNSRFSISSHGSLRPPSMMSSRASMASERVLFQNAEADDAASTYSRDGGETLIDETQQRTWSADGGANGDENDSSSLHPSSKRMSQPRLPPVKFPSESLSDSFNELTGASRRVSRALSIASSKRTSMIMEVKSKRDWSDVASLITVDEITAEVENRRENTKPAESSDEWTKVDFEDGLKQDSESETLLPQPEDLPVAVADEEAVEDEDHILDGDEYDEEEDEDDDGEEAGDEFTDGEHGKSISTQQGEKTIKWIKGALIGAGSFGQVYLGMDAATGLLMAVKQVSLPTGTGVNQERKKSMLSALEREIELLKDLQHENIVQYHTSCIDDEHLNIFLEYVPGGSVTALLRNYGAFEEVLVRNFVRQILQGLNYLHERDIIHRDIKGGNILVDNKGGIKISDFGISKKVEDSVLGGSRAHRPSLQGSVFWMAPEVVKQTAYTRKADIWSVGCLVVEMLTGEHPWAELTQLQAIFKIGSSAIPTIPSDISPEAENFLLLTFELNHKARPDASVLLQHAWITITKLVTSKPLATVGFS